MLKKKKKKKINHKKLQPLSYKDYKRKGKTNRYDWEEKCKLNNFL